MAQRHVMPVIKKQWGTRSSSLNYDCDKDTINRWETVLSAFLGNDRNKSIVDLGTGTGFLANITGRLEHPTIGIDISKEMLKYAVKRGEGCGSSAIYGRKTLPQSLEAYHALRFDWKPVEACYHTRLARHFYSEDDIDWFKQKWRKNVGEDRNEKRKIRK